MAQEFLIPPELKCAALAEMMDSVTGSAELRARTALHTLEGRWTLAVAHYRSWGKEPASAAALVAGISAIARLLPNLPSAQVRRVVARINRDPDEAIRALTDNRRHILITILHKDSGVRRETAETIVDACFAIGTRH